MVEVDVLNQKGEKVGKVKLPPEIFDVKINPDLIHQVVVCQMSNRRQGTVHTKNRAEVAGGGRKPWPQKYLGRARAGSIRSPIFRHGGVAHGPRKEKIWKKKLPKKMRRKALFMALTGKLKDKELILLDKLEIEKGKTKEMAEILENLKIKGKSVLIALPKHEKKIILATKNIKKAATIEAKNLNCLDVLSYSYLVLPLESVKVIKNTFLK